jgi:hypothetical protein
VRSLTGTPVRDLDAVTDKASLDVTLTAVVESLKQVAVTINDIPNAIFESIDSMRAYLNQEGAFQVQKALDAHVMSQIVAAAPPFGTSGTGLVARIRNGVATMRATGANPSLVVLNPTDAASLDLEADAGGYIFPTRDMGSASPLWGLRVIERIGAGTEAPYLIDPQMLGQLYLGNMRFEADPFTGFRKNLTTLRIETHALYHVRQAEGARPRQRQVVMAKVKLIVADNVTFNRDGAIRRPGETFQTNKDDEVERWLALGYVEQVKTRRTITKKKSS